MYVENFKLTGFKNTVKMKPLCSLLPHLSASELAPCLVGVSRTEHDEKRSILWMCFICHFCFENTALFLLTLQKKFLPFKKKKELLIFGSHILQTQINF